MVECCEKIRSTVDAMTKKLNSIRDVLEFREQIVDENYISKELVLLPILIEAEKIFDDLLCYLSHPYLKKPSVDANNIWHIIITNASSAETVRQGSMLIEKYVNMKMESIINPSDYLGTIQFYMKWQEETVRAFTKNYRETYKIATHANIEYLWNWNYNEHEKMFFSGASRPLHIRTVTDLSAFLSKYYDKIFTSYKNNRHELSAALNKPLREQSKKYWPDYEIFPLNDSAILFDKILYYVFFRDRERTWFIQSSALDYILYVHSARETFAEKFIGSNMTHPEQHNTEWILNNLVQECHRIYQLMQKKGEPTIIVLLTLKNRFGDCLDVDFIHQQLTRQFHGVITVVDACQSRTALSEADILLHSKRFCASGGFALLNKSFILKNPLLKRRLRPSTSFPVTIIAQIYVHLYLMNANLSHGVYELINSAWWPYTSSQIEDEIKETFNCCLNDRQLAVFHHNYITYRFTYDPNNIIITITSQNQPALLAKLWAYLQQQRHCLDCFVLENPYLKESERFDVEEIRELIEKKFINQLRHIESTKSNLFAWPLIPCNISSADHISVENLREFFETCYRHNSCLRLYIGRCVYPGKLRRFVSFLDNIMKSELLKNCDNTLSTYSSEWPL